MWIFAYNNFSSCYHIPIGIGSPILLTFLFEASRGAGAQSVALITTGCGLDSHSKK